MPAPADSPCVCHLVSRGGCQQGKFCPLSHHEAGNAVPLRPEFPAPKGKRMYRLSSSAFTGRAPRSMRDAFGCHPDDPVHPMPDANQTTLRDFFAAIGQVIARLFGR